MGTSLPFGVARKTREEFKAVHFRHHEVEQDDVWFRLCHALKGINAVLGDLDLTPFALQHLSQDCLSYVVVLDDKHARAGRAAPMSLKGAAQTVAIEGLGQVVGRAKRKSLLLFVEDAQHEHWNVGQLRIGFQLLEDGPPIHAWHHDVQGDQGRLELPRQAQALGSIGRSERIEALTREKAPHEVARIRIVVDHKHRWSASPRSRCSHTCAGFGRRV